MKDNKTTLLPVCSSGDGFVRITTVHGLIELGPADAVALWRCLVGELVDEDLHDARGCGLKYHMWVHVDPLLEVDTYELSSGKTVYFKLDSDEALALAWSLKSAVAKSLTAPTCRKDEPPRLALWALEAQVAFKADADDDELGLGGATRVFASYMSASAAAPDFIKPYVKFAETEAHWDRENIDDAVGEILKDVVTGSRGYRCWTYSGSTADVRVVLHDIPLEGSI